MKIMPSVVLTLCLVVGALSSPLHPKALDPPNPTEPPPPSDSPLGFYYDAAVTANCEPCNIVGRDVLMEGGNAVDAAIATLFCDGVASHQSMGLGGGFLMTIYNRSTGEVMTVNSREEAPAAAYEDMYGGDSDLSTFGGLAAGVPGELKGYWEVYKRYGSLPWSRLIEPTIQLCEAGAVVTPYQAVRLESREDQILRSETLSEILIDPETGRVYQEGDLIKRPGLAQTLRVVAAEGGDALYTGSLARGFVNDIQSLGGIITLQDLANYQVRWQAPVVANLEGNLTLYTVQAPGSGPVLTLMLNILDGFIPAPDQVTTHQRTTEAFKWAYAQRTWMGDPYFVDITDLLTNFTSKDYAISLRDKIFDDQTFQDPAYYDARTSSRDNHGTAHISVIDKFGSAVAVTSTVNGYWGSKVRSRTTDIILNNEMDDFSSPNITNMYGLPPNPENFIQPGKRPMSSMNPTVIVDGNGDARLVIGAAGGTKITSAVAWSIMRNLRFNETIKEAIDARRIHHQLYPMTLEYEYGVLQDIVTGLESIGHNTSRYDVGESMVSGLARDENGHINANADFRRIAVIAGY